MWAVFHPGLVPITGLAYSRDGASDTASHSLSVEFPFPFPVCHSSSVHDDTECAAELSSRDVMWDRMWDGVDLPEADGIGWGERRPEVFGAGKVSSEPRSEPPGVGEGKDNSLASMLSETGGETGRLLLADRLGENDGGLYVSASMYEAAVPDTETISMSSMSTEADVMLGEGEGWSIRVVCDGAGEGTRLMAAEEGDDAMGVGARLAGEGVRAVLVTASANGFSM